MAFVRVSGKQNIEHWAKAASTAFTVNSLVYDNGSGYIIPADSTSGDHSGVILQTIATTDSDYASATKVMVDVAGENDIFEVDCGGAATAALVGTFIDLTSAVVANEAASSKDALLVVGYISASKLLVKIASRKNILRTATT
jgi:hypothetical protein